MKKLTKEEIDAFWETERRWQERIDNIGHKEYNREYEIQCWGESRCDDD